jgi:predicted NBD/HSP70 family sugar kinase
VRAPLDAIVSALGAVADPEVIVLGGRLPTALAEALIADVRPFEIPRRGALRPLPSLVPARVTGEPTALGAAVLPLKAHFFG